MQSRSERYYKLASEQDSKIQNRRTVLNKKLYDEIYKEAGYDNDSDVINFEKTSEIDISRIKELLKDRNETRSGSKPPIIPPVIEEVVEEEDEKNYDIQEVLTKAKEERKEEVQYHSLKNTPYQILKGINISASRPADTLDEDDSESLKEMIHTITNTSVINKMEDRDLSLDVLSDLKSTNENTITTKNESIRKIIKAQEEKKTEKTAVLDKSFYTSGISFNADDFDSEEETPKSGMSILAKVIIFILAVAIAVGIIFGIYIYLK